MKSNNSFEKLVARAIKSIKTLSTGTASQIVSTGIMASVSPTSIGSIDSVISEHSIMSTISKVSSNGSKISKTTSSTSKATSSTSKATYSTSKATSKGIKKLNKPKNPNESTFTFMVSMIILSNQLNHRYKQSLDDLKYHVYVRGSLTGSEYHRRLNDIKDDSL